MRNIEENEGVYEVGAAAMLLGARRVLPDAVPPVPSASSAEAGAPAATPATYGWVMGVLPAPSKDDHYLVEFVGKRAFRILAYVDRYGRVFSTDCPLRFPPACAPDMAFARFSEQPAAGEELGCVEVHADDGSVRQTAQYRCVRDRYTLFDSWYDFGPYAVDLCYDDALARAYLAFVHRPRQGAADVPERGVSLVRNRLRGGKLLPALASIADDVRRAEADPLTSPPALLRTLLGWLDDAGLPGIRSRKVADDALRLARTVRYANTYFVALEDEKAAVSRREVWALEAALNRYLLVEEAFGERASLATDADCSRWDDYLRETAGAQAPSTERAAGWAAGEPGGEWEVRSALGAALERLRLPYRVEARLQADAAEGVAALDVTVPDALLMPARRWADAGGWTAVPLPEREDQARRYGMHAALALAAAAFGSAPGIQRVDLVVRPFEDEQPQPGESSGADREFPVETALPAYCQVTLPRSLFEATGGFAAARNADPVPLFVQAGAVFDIPGADAFAVVDACASAARRRLLPESADGALAEAARSVLGADGADGMRIDAEARRRRIGEGLADRIARAASATEAIRIVREEQSAAVDRGDERTSAAATRLMAALAEGSLDTEDQNAAVRCFLGEDRCLAALGRARDLVQKAPDQAVSILMDAVAESAALDGYADGTTTVYRSFDSYASRVQYNRALRDALHAAGEGEGGGNRPAAALLSEDAAPSLAELAAADAGRRVELVPDSFYLCHLEIVRLLEHSFERTDEALRYGRLAIRLAPATAAGYRQLGRAYMLVGDMDNAIAVLGAGLRVATQPPDIAVAYYQLAYALWKTGKPLAGAACYLKSVMTSPVVALQATAELRELAEEHGIDPIERDDVDRVLDEAGIVLAPSEELLDVLDGGSAVAVDAGLFPVARNLLSLRLHYRPDDALANVLRSLEAPAS